MDWARTGGVAGRWGRGFGLGPGRGLLGPDGRGLGLRLGPDWGCWTRGPGFWTWTRPGLGVLDDGAGVLDWARTGGGGGRGWGAEPERGGRGVSVGRRDWARAGGEPRPGAGVRARQARRAAWLRSVAARSRPEVRRARELPAPPDPGAPPRPACPAPAAAGAPYGPSHQGARRTNRGRALKPDVKGPPSRAPGAGGGGGAARAQDSL